MEENKNNCSNEQLLDKLNIKLKVFTFLNYILSIVIGILTALLWH